MGVLESFFEWAWARHHNILSWYIRPLFLFPFCYFAYRRSLIGIGVTMIALLTSMFWFPVPTTVSPAIMSALQAEKEYLLGPWNIWKVLLVLLIPLSFYALAAAFWRRSYRLGIAVVNAMILIKILWTFAMFDRQAILSHLVPALLGLVAVNLGLLYWLSHKGETKLNKV